MFLEKKNSNSLMADAFANKARDVNFREKYHFSVKYAN
jgi:hypothetical protein